jgi:voltage-gated potassium channel
MKQRRFLRTASLVASVPLFEGLSASDIAHISRLLEPLVVKAGQIVVRRGETATSMFFIVDGTLEVEVEGHRKHLSSEFFGEIALLEAGVRSATIRTLTRCQLLELQSRHFDEIMAASPRIERAVHTVAGQRRERDAQWGHGNGENGGDPTS